MIDRGCLQQDWFDSLQSTSALIGTHSVKIRLSEGAVDFKHHGIVKAEVLHPLENDSHNLGLVIQDATTCGLSGLLRVNLNRQRLLRSAPVSTTRMIPYLERPLLVPNTRCPLIWPSK